MRWLIAASMLLTSPAFAADVVWTTADTTSVRFSDAATAGPTFSAFTRLSVVYEDGDLLRVHDGPNFGWIARGTVTEEEPAEAADSTIPGLDEILKNLGGPGSGGGLMMPPTP